MFFYNSTIFGQSHFLSKSLIRMFFDISTLVEQPTKKDFSVLFFYHFMSTYFSKHGKSHYYCALDIFKCARNRVIFNVWLLHHRMSVLFKEIGHILDTFVMQTCVYITSDKWNACKKVVCMYVRGET